MSSDSHPLIVEHEGDTFEPTEEQLQFLLSRGIINMGEDGVYHPTAGYTVDHVRNFADEQEQL